MCSRDVVEHTFIEKWCPHIVPPSGNTWYHLAEKLFTNQLVPPSGKTNHFSHMCSRY